MKATGMIRRIDELGRVVIPKEIRRSMRIKEGEELEIFAQDEGLVLKKYSALSDLEEEAARFASVLAGETDGEVLVADRNRALAWTGKGELALPPAIEQALKERRKGVVSCPELPFGSAYVEPILVGGDLMGGVALCKGDYTPSDLGKVRLVRSLLESQLDRG